MNAKRVDILVRAFAPADQGAARAVILEGLGEHFGAIDETLNPDLNDIAAAYAAGVFLVACDGDAIVGTGADAAGGRRGDRLADVDGGVTPPAWRGAGGAVAPGGPGV